MLKRFREPSESESDVTSSLDILSVAYADPDRRILAAQKSSAEFALAELQLTAKREKELLRTEKMQLEISKMELERECEMLRNKLKTLLEDKQAEHIRSMDSEEQLNDRLNQVVKTCNTVESKLLEELEELRRESLCDKHRITELEVYKAEADAKLSELSLQLETRSKRLNELESYVSEKRNELEDHVRLNTLVEKLQIENKSLEERLVLAEKRSSLPENFQLHPKGIAHVTKLELECERLRSAYKSLSKERADWLVTKEENDDLRTQVENLKQWRQRALSAENALAEKVELTSSPVNSSSISPAHVLRLERENQLLLAEQGELRAKLAELQANLAPDTRQSNLQRNPDELASHDWVESELAHSPIQKVQSDSANRDLFLELRHRISSLEEELAAAESSKRSLQEHIDGLMASGAYDRQTTKVLTLKANPTAEVQASVMDELARLRPENERLRQRNKVLEDCLVRLRERDSNESAVGSVTLVVDERLKDHPDPLTELAELREELRVERLRQDRLMEMFDKASAKFRKACRSLFGYRLEVKPSGEYKIRSVLNNEPNEFIVFKEMRGHYELQENDYTQRLPQTVRSYLNSDHSIPGFFASLILYYLQQDTMII